MQGERERENFTSPFSVQAGHALLQLAADGRTRDALSVECVTGRKEGNSLIPGSQLGCGRRHHAQRAPGCGIA